MKTMPAKQRVGSKCEGTLYPLYMNLFHARYTHNQACEPYLKEAIALRCNPKSGKTDGKKSLLAHNYIRTNWSH